MFARKPTLPLYWTGGASGSPAVVGSTPGWPRNASGAVWDTAAA
jgi:hypothetical protein